LKGETGSGLFAITFQSRKSSRFPSQPDGGFHVLRYEAGSKPLLRHLTRIEHPPDSKRLEPSPKDGLTLVVFPLPTFDR
jgi:hypothetical protein